MQRALPIFTNPCVNIAQPMNEKPRSSGNQGQEQKTGKQNQMDCTCITLVRPEPNVIDPIKKVSISKVRSLEWRPKVSGSLNTTHAATTIGMVRPILAIADPIVKFILVCNRSALAARTAAQASGKSTIAAITMPAIALGAFANSITEYIEGDRSFAEPTTQLKEMSNKNKLNTALFLDGGDACTDSSEADSVGRK